MESERDNLVNIAKGELGTRETGTNVVKYNELFIDPITKKARNGLAWCTAFVSWCAAKAGIGQDRIVYTLGAADMMNWFIKNGKFKKAGSYTPVPGDICFEHTEGSGTKCTHSCIVCGCDGTYLYTIDGNYSDSVKLAKDKLNEYSLILGYGVWSSGSASINIVTSIAGSAGSTYTCTTTVTTVPTVYGEYLESLSHEERSEDYGLLTGTSVYINIPDAVVSGQTIITETKKDEKGNTIKETYTMDVYSLTYTPSDCSSDPAKEKETIKLLLKETVQNALGTLTSANTENITGIKYNTNGTYEAKEIPTLASILKKAELIIEMTSLLEMGCHNDVKVTITKESLMNKLDSAANAKGNSTSDTTQIKALLNIKSAVDKYGNAIKNGMKCVVCGKAVPYMPVLGFCSILCFTTDLTKRLLIHLTPDYSNPVVIILEHIKHVLDFFNLVINVLVELPDLLINIANLPLEIKNYVLLNINIVFLKLRIIINWLLIKKNEGIILILKEILKGFHTPAMEVMFALIEAVLVIVLQLDESFNLAYSTAMKILENPALGGINPESYAWLSTPRSIMNGDWLGYPVINLPIGGLMSKLIPTMCNINMESIDNFVKTTFPPILPVEYFMDPDLFDIRFALSDRSDIVKKTIETLEALLTYGCDYLPRWKRLTILNPYFVLAILDGWAVHAKRDFGSLILPYALI